MEFFFFFFFTYQIFIFISQASIFSYSNNWSKFTMPSMNNSLIMQSTKQLMQLINICVPLFVHVYSLSLCLLIDNIFIHIFLSLFFWDLHTFCLSKFTFLLNNETKGKSESFFPSLKIFSLFLFLPFLEIVVFLFVNGIQMNYDQLDSNENYLTLKQNTYLHKTKLIKRCTVF